jgi:hypothetical protein
MFEEDALLRLSISKVTEATTDVVAVDDVIDLTDTMMRWFIELDRTCGSWKWSGSDIL